MRGKEFRLEPDQHAALLAGQDGICAICRGPGGARGLAVDHEHSTGRIRGLLCGACNSAIGLLKEEPEFFRRAILYLKKEV